MRDHLFHLRQQIAKAKVAPLMFKPGMIGAAIDTCCMLMGEMIERIERLEENAQATKK